MPHTGHCLCGASRYSIDADPNVCIECHCDDCRKVTGSGHASQVGVPLDAVQLTGPIREFHGTSDRGNELVFAFCGECGSPIYKSTALAPQSIFVYAGSLADPTLFKNPIVVFEDNRLPWDRSA